MVLTLTRCPCSIIWIIALLHVPIVVAFGKHDAAFWKAIADHNFGVPAGESVGALALEIADLTAETDPILRDSCGYGILAAWIYHKDLLSSEQLEALRRKLLPVMSFHIGESESDTVFRRSFSALYMSILAAQDLRKPFLSDAAFQETLTTALQCYAEEKDLRGYVPEKGWAHATAHVADLLKFLARIRSLLPKTKNGLWPVLRDGVALQGRFSFGEKMRESPPHCLRLLIEKTSTPRCLMNGSKL